MTDEKIIENLRKAARRRRPLGLCFIAIGVIGMALILYWVHDLQVRSDALLDRFVHLPPPATQPLLGAIETIRGNHSFAFGFMAAAGLAGMADCIVYGVLWLLIPNRKDALLLRLWDRQTPSGQ